VNPEVGHTDIISIGVDKGDGDSTAPIFDNGALFSGKLLPGLFNFLPAHEFLTTFLFPAALKQTPVNRYYLIGYRPQLSGSSLFAE